MTGSSMDDPGNVAFVNALYDKFMSLPAGQRPRLLQSEITRICTLTKTALVGDPNMIRVTPPVTIVGDIHGQYDALRSLLGPDPLAEGRQWLFLGDYVDRGPHSLEVIVLLFVLKCKARKSIWLTRGNHECAAVTQLYGFHQECARWGSAPIWKTFIAVFTALPFAAVVGRRFFCVHGGISPELTSMDLIDNLKRPCENPDRGLLCDLLWADPNTSPEAPPFMKSEREAGHLFSGPAAKAFLERFGFTLLIRCHQMVMEGYEWPFGEDGRVVTLFSAPNYAGEFSNKGAIMLVDAELNYTFEMIQVQA